MDDMVVEVTYRLLDEELMDDTYEQYQEAVERGDMDAEEAIRKLAALFYGMMVIEFT
jgi:hypothetical protein